MQTALHVQKTACTCLSRFGAAYSRTRYSRVKIMTQAVSTQNSWMSNRSPHVRDRPSTDVGSGAPHGTVSMMLVITETIMKNPVMQQKTRAHVLEWGFSKPCHRRPRRVGGVGVFVASLPAVNSVSACIATDRRSARSRLCSLQSSYDSITIQPAVSLVLYAYPQKNLCSNGARKQVSK